jgi:DNA helicase II / ATP-dependent DNA helicase PcrA
MSLNPSQKKAVEATDGRVLILAGAGSGKTSVLTYRIAHLLDTKRALPEEILGLTFTNKAASEMRERLRRLIDEKRAKAVTLSTFHSFCMQILRKEIHHLGYTKEFTLYDERDVQRLGKQIARSTLEHEGELPPLEETLNQISYAKSRGTLPEGSFSMSLFEQLKTALRAYNAVDFDSLLSLSVELLEKYPVIAARYQERFRYIMIDEYQDTSPIQYKLAMLLSAKHGNLCVVGDDDQSIYGWRGAEIKNILDFSAQTVIKLEQNYRSTPTILHAANSVIAHNSERHDKKLWSAADKGELITLFHAPTENDEATAVVQRMIKLHDEKNVPWKEMAILYRSNILSRAFETALLQATWKKNGSWVRSIPYEVFGGTSFYQRAEIKDIMAYLRLISNPLDQEALLRIINIPRRGISDATLDKLTQYNRERKIPLWDLLSEIASPLSSEVKNSLSSMQISAIRTFVELIESLTSSFQKRPLHEALSQLVEEIDYNTAIEEEVKSEKMRQFKRENVSQCIDALALYEEEMLSQNQEEEISLSHFLSTTMLINDAPFEKNKQQKEDKVNVMTFHSAKGLEFTACFLVGLEEQIIPHEKSMKQTGIEEERRLMYVAMTRAKRHLTLSMARNRKKMGKESPTNPSRFLFEIPKELLNVTPWRIP